METGLIGDAVIIKILRITDIKHFTLIKSKMVLKFYSKYFVNILSGIFTWGINFYKDIFLKKEDKDETDIETIRVVESWVNIESGVNGDWGWVDE